MQTRNRSSRQGIPKPSEGKWCNMFQQRKGDAYDNAMTESLRRTPKRELMSGRRFESREEAKKEVSKFIELCCNSVRMRPALNMPLPGDLKRGIRESA